MNKNDFIDKIAQKTGLTKKDSKAYLEALLETITETLAKGDDVALIGFGTFSTSKRAAREGINPATGEKIQIAESTVAKFKVGANLKNSIRDAK